MSTRQRKRRDDRRHEHSGLTRRRLIAAGGLTAGATLAFSGAAQAATTYTVGSNADTNGASDCTTATNTDCTLRQAIMDANANSGADTIVFASSLSGQTITMGADPQTITDPVSIQGPGAAQLTVNGDGDYSAFYVDMANAGDPVAISGLTMTNGYKAGNGAAVFNNNADLMLSNVAVTDSYTALAAPTAYVGGGIYSNGGSLTIDHSTVSGNHAYYGGGVGAGGGDVTISNSTVSGNYADGDVASSGEQGYGGGVWSSSADVTIISSTVSGNVAAYDGGGIYVKGHDQDVTIKNSTFANNQAYNDDGGGIWDYASSSTLTVIGSTVVGNSAATRTGGIEASVGGPPVLQNSIVSGNTSATDPETDDVSTGDNFDTAFSLIGVPSTYVNETVPGSNLAAGTNPQLGPLASNGGPTETMLPADTSPVVNKGSAFGLTSDQRDLTRPVSFPGVANSSAAGADGSDMGAVELQSTPTPLQPPPPAQHKKKCKKKKKHKRSAESSKKKCKKKKKKH
jgi:predicted outer membrane repeat protein